MTQIGSATTGPQRWDSKSIDPSLISEIRAASEGEHKEAFATHPHDDEHDPAPAAANKQPGLSQNTKQVEDTPDVGSLLNALVGTKQDADEDGNSQFQQWWNSERGQIQRGTMMDMIGGVGAALASIPMGGGAMNPALLGRISGAGDRARQRFHTRQYRSRLNTLLQEEMSKPEGERDEKRIMDLMSAIANPGDFAKNSNFNMALKKELIDYQEAYRRGGSYKEQEMIEVAKNEWDNFTDKERADIIADRGKSFGYRGPDNGAMVRIWKRQKLLDLEDGETRGQKGESGESFFSGLSDWFGIVSDLLSGSSEGDPVGDALATDAGVSAAGAISKDKVYEGMTMDEDAAGGMSQDVPPTGLMDAVQQGQVGEASPFGGAMFLGDLAGIAGKGLFESMMPGLANQLKGK